MYSFAELSGVHVVDEPLYGHYLRVSDAPHPGREEVMDTLDCDGQRVMQSLLRQQAEEPSKRLFIKHMAHHLEDLDLKFLHRACNIFLLRDPREMLPSLSVQLPNPSLRDTGLMHQWEVFSELAESGTEALVLDSRELLLDPAGILRTVCDRLDIEFDLNMLSWEAGPRPEDGVWAKHWYHAVHKSTGFAPYRPKDNFPDHLQSLLDECSPWYDKLFEHAIRSNATGDTV